MQATTNQKSYENDQSMFASTLNEHVLQKIRQNLSSLHGTCHMYEQPDSKTK